MFLMLSGCTYTSSMGFVAGHAAQSEENDSSELSVYCDFDSEGDHENADNTTKEHGDGLPLSEIRIHGLSPTIHAKSLVSNWELISKKKLQESLEHNLLGVDAKWMLFVTAIMSYRYRKTVIPYPLSSLKPESESIVALSLFVSTMPAMLTLKRELEAACFNSQPPEHIALLYWLLFESGTPSLRRLPNDEEVLLWSLLGQKPSVPPDLLFGVQLPDENRQQISFDCSCDHISWGFCSGHMDGMYALLSSSTCPQKHQPLLPSLEEALAQARLCTGWSQSLCGSLLRCVAVCELLPRGACVRFLLMYGQSVGGLQQQAKQPERPQHLHGKLRGRRAVSWLNYKRTNFAAVLFGFAAVSVMVIYIRDWGELLLGPMERVTELIERWL
ncbi:protein mono-ADP-ribosyltransferase PARP16-like [Scaptodrosophila lebanonensis]|uniref:Protein mono-ADP-ribosyltransferase PARP16-like n=1 Tax=Drosophila lebanonensis TaxID=7225 RepID=A0A6J2TZL9_DROLE|nr:protein mono-ADP-ribosyltransferase PARP16-like [Scaptodrosophila lebanonensis]